MYHNKLNNLNIEGISSLCTSFFHKAKNVSLFSNQLYTYDTIRIVASVFSWVIKNINFVLLSVISSKLENSDVIFLNSSILSY